MPGFGTDDPLVANSTICRDRVSSQPQMFLTFDKVTVVESVFSQDFFSATDRDSPVEDWPVIHKRVILAVLTARVSANRQLRQKRLVDFSAYEVRSKNRRVNACSDCL